MSLFTWTWIDEIVENTDLKDIFKHISISALKTHQVKLFRVTFGPEEDRPDPEEFLDYMFLTHARLFRECGMDETHFDLVAESLVRGLQTFHVNQAEIDEVLEILGPVRVVFEEGARVAAVENTIDPEELSKLPVVSAKTIGTGQAVSLPTYSVAEIPDWLPLALGSKKKRKHNSTVRAWTCELTNRFGEEGDKEIADTFLDQPYMDHHVYLVAFLQLAFMPNDAPEEHIHKMREAVKYPRGTGKAPLSQYLFDRMVTQFKLTCFEMGMSSVREAKAVDRLYSHRHHFTMTKITVGGINAPHCLSKMPQSLPEGPLVCSLDVVAKTKPSKKIKKKKMKTDDETASTRTDNSLRASSRKKKGWRLFHLARMKSGN